jgi:hypothetical protein
MDRKQFVQNVTWQKKTHCVNGLAGYTGLEAPAIASWSLPLLLTADGHIYSNLGSSLS